jgi:hypothetical protein
MIYSDKHLLPMRKVLDNLLSTQKDQNIYMEGKLRKEEIEEK